MRTSRVCLSSVTPLKLPWYPSLFLRLCRSGAVCSLLHPRYIPVTSQLVRGLDCSKGSSFRHPFLLQNDQHRVLVIFYIVFNYVANVTSCLGSRVRCNLKCVDTEHQTKSISVFEFVNCSWKVHQQLLIFISFRLVMFALCNICLRWYNVIIVLQVLKLIKDKKNKSTEPWNVGGSMYGRTRWQPFTIVTIGP